MRQGRKKNISGEGKPIVSTGFRPGEKPVGNGKNWLNTYQKILEKEADLAKGKAATFMGMLARDGLDYTRTRNGVTRSMSFS